MEIAVRLPSPDMAKVISDSQFERVECPVCDKADRHSLLFRIETHAEVIYSRPSVVVTPATVVIEIKCQRCGRVIKLTLKLPVEFIEPGEVELG